MFKQIHIKHHFEQISSEKAFPFLPAMGPISVSSLYEMSLGSPFESRVDSKPESLQRIHWRCLTHSLASVFDIIIKSYMESEGKVPAKERSRQHESQRMAKLAAHSEITMRVGRSSANGNVLILKSMWEQLTTQSETTPLPTMISFSQAVGLMTRDGMEPWMWWQLDSLPAWPWESHHTILRTSLVLRKQNKVTIWDCPQS